MAQNYVNLIQDRVIHLNRVSSSMVSQLVRLGAVPETTGDNQRWLLHASNDEDLATSLERLRDMNVAFQAAPAGWPPAEIVDVLRESGDFKGEFKELLFYGPDRWTIKTR